MKSSPTSGFTIVELIIAITVMGIIAGISIGGYGAWRDSVATKEVKADMSSFQSAMKAKLNFDNDGLYPSVTFPSGTNDSGFTPSNNVKFSGGTATDRLSYCVVASSVARTSISYYLSSTTSEPVAGTSCP